MSYHKKCVRICVYVNIYIHTAYMCALSKVQMARANLKCTY